MTEIHHKQQGSSITRFCGRIFPVYLAFISFATILFGVLNVQIRANWAIGDWLINYRGGFVRRGFTGEIALCIAHALHLSPSIVVLLMQLFFYAVIFYVIWKLSAI